MGKANIIEAVAVNSRIDFRYAFKIQKQNGIELYIKKKKRTFIGCPAVKTPHFYKGPKLDPWVGN